MKKGFVIAIDGPVASGKGTIAARLAKEIHGVNFNTGGMYRALALKAYQESIPLTDSQKLIPFITKKYINLDINPENPSHSVIMLEGRNVTQEIQSPEMSMGASQVALLEEIPPRMYILQREVALEAVKKGLPVVMEGRQIGTEVLPDADLKIFLTADLPVRAKRRLEQYATQGMGKTIKDVAEQTRIRDEQDSNRKVGALVKNPDKQGYFILDNSQMDENQTLSVIIDELKRRNLL